MGGGEGADCMRARSGGGGGGVRVCVREEGGERVCTRERERGG